MSRPEQPPRPADSIPVERVGVLSRRPLLAGVVIGAVVVVTLALRPWEAAQRTALPAPQAGVAVASPPVASFDATPSPTPSTDPAIDAADSRMLCNAPPG